MYKIQLLISKSTMYKIEESTKKPAEKNPSGKRTVDREIKTTFSVL